MLSIYLIILSIIINYYVHTEAKTFYNKRIIEKKIQPKIYDIGEKYIPDLSNNHILHRISDIIVLILPLCFGQNILKKHASYIIPIFLIRYFFISLTILPKNKSCDDNSMGIHNYIFGHCYDKIFSGHFAVIFLLSLILYDNGYNYIFLILLNIINTFLILAIRSHYTIDIAVAAIVVIVSYQNKLTLHL